MLLRLLRLFVAIGIPSVVHPPVLLVRPSINGWTLVVPRSEGGGLPHPTEAFRTHHAGRHLTIILKTEFDLNRRQPSKQRHKNLSESETAGAARAGPFGKPVQCKSLTLRSLRFLLFNLTAVSRVIRRLSNKMTYGCLTRR